MADLHHERPPYTNTVTDDVPDFHRISSSQHAQVWYKAMEKGKGAQSIRLGAFVMDMPCQLSQGCKLFMVLEKIGILRMISISLSGWR